MIIPLQQRKRRKQIMSEDLQRELLLGEIQSLSSSLSLRHQLSSFFYSPAAAFIQRRRLSLWEIYSPNNASHSKRLLFAALSTWSPNNSFQFAKFPAVVCKHCWRWQIWCYSQQIAKLIWRKHNNVKRTEIWVEKYIFMIHISSLNISFWQWLFQKRDCSCCVQ